MKKETSLEPQNPAVSDGGLNSCQAGSDGECNDEMCPQKRDNEPIETGRFCPLPHWSDNRD